MLHERNKLMKTIFIAGTDTNVGKTYVTSLLLKQFNAKGYKTFGMKPIASGCEDDAGHLKNEDALILQQSASLFRPYESVNSISLKDPIAPHLAAFNMGRHLSKNEVTSKISASLQIEADINLIEGVGGWAVPLNEQELFSEVVCDLQIPVIVVVGMKLGCLNHAILTYHHMSQMNVPLIGWIANCIDADMLAINDNIVTLKRWLRMPCIDIVGHGSQEIDIKIIEQYLLNGNSNGK
jgi:dethiobiotin synthetase